jgi:tetratricopeptide (TPR) repeat protein
MSLAPFLKHLWSLRPRSRTALTLDWERHFASGTQAIREGHPGAAESGLRAALAAARRFGAGDPRLPVSLDALAAFYRLQGRFDQAEPLCREALALKERMHGPDDPNVASTLGDLAEISRALGRPDEAGQYQARAAAILRAAIGDDFDELEESLRRSQLLDDEEHSR